ncbi:DUF998 domain-containing protein [Micromonospora purpureochromogenes]|uniref:DUF998 domain-containing protein n=1 Tax=Micromonospora purpureochromogenes TaxID=47872 RepID=A0ABX2RQW0_9ACTN|nr:DUF998 domain-containing protein [Micromonospora purpureochromogenes]NYF57536.1 hypothetical protein [Micromonospora purpureochromogenes]
MADPDRAVGPARAAAASAAAGCLLAGTVAVTVAVVAGPGPGLTGYVSEAGVADSGYAPTYRIGVFALAAALLLLATALPAALRLAAALLGAGSVFTLLSAVVRCSTGCPLPPFQAATVADLVHGGSSIAAVAAVVFAMLALAWSPATTPALRRVSALGGALALPLSGAIALAMLVAGRGGLVGGLERVLLAVTFGWGLAAATALGLRRDSTVTKQSTDGNRAL